MMLTRLPLLAALLGPASSLPNPLTSNDDPVRILPSWWSFNITALEGPGCPDYGDTTSTFVTRPTYGMNTVDGSEIYYWHFAYPHFRASVGSGTPEASIWCETTLAYNELDIDGAVVDEPEYRLKMHKNGTRVLALYELEEGVQVEWKATYYTGEDEIVDTLTVAGPRAAGPYNDVSPTDELVQWTLPECGRGTIKYRTELTVTATKEGARGTVSSDHVETNGETEYYGAQQGVSYDFEKCAA